MSQRNPDSEAALERATIDLFRDLGWQTASGEHEHIGPRSTYGRETLAEVVLPQRLRRTLERLNPDLPSDALSLAFEELTRDRRLLDPARANREIYLLLKDGVKLSVKDEYDEEQPVTVRVIEWDDPAANEFLLLSQVTITGDMYTRRPDLLGFINGLPLVFIELKAHQRNVIDAYQDNLRDYKQSIPQLFWYNALVILSNGSESRIGTITSEWEHFATWKKITSEGETGVIALDTMIRGTCDPARLLDLVENFTLYREGSGGLAKLIAQNHQYLGVQNAIAAARDVQQRQGRLGVFWHTQGSGKSYSMIFFAQKVLRTLPGNWTFVIVTDRQDLDKQIYQTFAAVGAVTEPEEETRADSAPHLRQLLAENHRYIFTLIQKFRTVPGQPYAPISDRSDIIVITDEAHRSQYDTFALNMRTALPNAAFLGFTGTPLLTEGEERTRDVFGDYVSVYNFRQSIEDGATVPLYYENRIPQLQITNIALNDELGAILDAAALDDEQEQRLEREFTREYQLITRDERLERIAEDIVAHYISRGYQGKAMVVAIDKATAVRMYDKVQACWQQTLADLRAQLATADPLQRPALEDQIARMSATDMAVVVSSAQNEVEDFRQRGLDIAPHRRRMIREDLETDFKDPDHPLQIVFVCAMWMTGFDVPSCSTIYLDKPMRNHTLMQTIARANRVYANKVSGLIVDYIGIFRNLQEALAIYGTANGGGIEADDTPVADKSALVAQLRQAIAELETFCQERGVDPGAITAANTTFARIAATDTAIDRLIDRHTDDTVADAVEQVIVNDEIKRRYLLLASTVDRLFKAILPHPDANEFGPKHALFQLIATKIRALSGTHTPADTLSTIERVLDESISPLDFVISPSGSSPAHQIDLSQLDLVALQRHFDQQPRKRTEVEKLRGTINQRLQRLVRLNKTRRNYLETFQQLIDDYNAGASDPELLFAHLLGFVRTLSAEEQRGMAEHLTEEELALFDLLTRPDLPLSPEEREGVKRVAQDLLEALKQSKLVLDWRKKQQARAAVRVLIRNTLDRLPAAYTTELYEQKVETVYQHVFESYYGPNTSIYSQAA